MQGVIQVSQEMNEKQIAILNVVFKSNGVPLRQIVEEIQQSGFPDAKYLPQGDKNDLQDILQEEVDLNRNKFVFTLVLMVPILILMWVIPYTSPMFLVSYPLLNGMPLYIFVLLIFSTLV